MLAELSSSKLEKLGLGDFLLQFCCKNDDERK